MRVERGLEASLGGGIFELRAECREISSHVALWRRAFQAEETASAKALRRKCVWRFKKQQGGLCSGTGVSDGESDGDN